MATWTRLTVIQGWWTGWRRRRDQPKTIYAWSMDTDSSVVRARGTGGQGLGGGGQRGCERGDICISVKIKMFKKRAFSFFF